MEGGAEVDVVPFELEEDLGVLVLDVATGVDGIDDMIGDLILTSAFGPDGIVIEESSIRTDEIVPMFFKIVEVNCLNISIFGEVSNLSLALSLINDCLGSSEWITFKDKEPFLTIIFKLLILSLLAFSNSLNSEEIGNSKAIEFRFFWLSRSLLSLDVLFEGSNF
ncbi:hypothetical protein WICMUC_004382 [Wickerhamomyces mucosus]|uniref:Uncharacterized protein n=1 Tax=Wickerhamomyces mucosus TaxID=1378264 RepID=A0A9P8PHP7_9ASCO|nr:hypothetical protein WICMUC_004382 [Wickerhamomyces mucosus]